MKSYVKTLVIYIIYIGCFLFMNTLAYNNISSSISPTYTDEEKKYIEELETIHLCVDPDWYPYEMLDEKGNHGGIGAEIINLIAQKSGIQIHVLPTKNWTESLALSKDGRSDGLTMLNKTAEREKWLEFTEPYFVDPNVIITREEHEYISDASRLIGETLVLPSGTSIEEVVRKSFPNIKILIVETEAEAMAYVSEKKADMTIRSLTMAAFVIKKEGLFNLKISGEIPDLDNQFRIGISKEHADVIPILNKAIATITPMEIQGILNNHIAIQVQKGFNYELFFIVFGILIFVLCMIFMWNIQLTRLNKKLDERQVELLALGEELQKKNMLLSEQNMYDRLTGINNRTFFDQQINLMMGEQTRYGYELTLCMFDLDNFKQVNDLYGHDRGDEVLIRIADETRKQLRASDIFARWGGEEFMILFPHTDIDKAYVAADKIRLHIEHIQHIGIGKVTVSMGLANRNDRESYESWFKRADHAMYSAKRNGRNQIQVAPSADTAVYMYIEWNENWCSGNNSIDKQHKHLLEVGNKLMHYVTQKNDQYVLTTLDELLTDIVEHFNSEEQILEEIGYLGFYEHKNAHQHLLEAGKKFRTEMMNGHVNTGAVVNLVVNTIIMDHMLKEDVLYFSSLK